MTDISEFAAVIGVAPNRIDVEIHANEGYQALDRRLEVGSYLKIYDDEGATVIAIVQSYRIKDRTPNSADEEPDTPMFVLETQPVGRLEDGMFRRGGKQITIPPTHVEIASSELLAEVYANVDEEKRFSFGVLGQDESVRVVVDGDKFFGKHIGVVGSTGSGKSCTVARILQAGIAPTEGQTKRGILNNSHIIIFDLHGEYKAAFPAARVIGVDDLKLPYWLMNAEELEEMFIESNEENSHNQVSQFRQAVVENKQRHSESALTISYDSPVYFSLDEVYNYLANLNAEMIGKAPNEGVPKLADGTLVHKRADHYFEREHEFAPSSQAAGTKASNGPFNGEFARFLMRLDGRRTDTRLGFLLSVGVSLMTRLIFTFSFHLRRNMKTDDRDLPFLLVYEEAHNYVPRHEGAKYHSVKRAIERIAKEGRKYGISLMIVSQRPAEISETVFSQCNNFVAMRLTNPADQQYVRRLLPDDLAAITGALPSLEQREAIVIGDSISVPSLVRVDEITDTPDSHDIPFHTEWQKDWYDVAMKAALKRWQT